MATPYFKRAWEMQALHEPTKKKGNGLVNSQFILLVLKYSLFFFPSKNISLPQGRQLKAPPSLILGSQVIADTTPFRCGSWEPNALSEKTKYLSSSPHNTHYTMIQQRLNESSVHKRKWWETRMEQLWDPGSRHCEPPSSTNTLRQGGVSWYILILLSGRVPLSLIPSPKICTQGISVLSIRLHGRIQGA